MFVLDVLPEGAAGWIPCRQPPRHGGDHTHQVPEVLEAQANGSRRLRGSGLGRTQESIRIRSLQFDIKVSSTRVCFLEHGFNDVSFCSFGSSGDHTDASMNAISDM